MTNLERDDPFFLNNFAGITDAVAPKCSQSDVNDLYRLAFSQRNLLKAYRSLLIRLKSADDTELQQIAAEWDQLQGELNENL